MNVIYAYEKLSTDGITPSIFLAGPTPRAPNVAGWRGEAINLLSVFGFPGDVLVPEPRDGVYSEIKEEQWLWEATALDAATVIAFWVPRDMETMPGLTTNDEWGMWKASGKVVYGAPPSAPHTAYQRWWCQRLSVPCQGTLLRTMTEAIEMTWRINAANRSAAAANAPSSR